MHRNFPRFLKDRIQEQGLSVRKFALKCEISPGYVSRIISGDREPGNEVLKRMANALHFDVDRFSLIAGRVQNEELIEPIYYYLLDLETRDTNK